MDKLNTIDTLVSRIERLTTMEDGYVLNEGFSQEDEYLLPSSIASDSDADKLINHIVGLTEKTLAILDEEDCLNISILSKLRYEDLQTLLVRMTLGQKHLVRKVINDYKTGALYQNYCEQMLSLPEEKNIPDKLKGILMKEDLNLSIFSELPENEKSLVFATLSIGHTHILKQSMESINARNKPLHLDSDQKHILSNDSLELEGLPDISCESFQNKQNEYSESEDHYAEIGDFEICKKSDIVVNEIYDQTHDGIGLQYTQQHTHLWNTESKNLTSTWKKKLKDIKRQALGKDETKTNKTPSYPPALPPRTSMIVLDQSPPRSSTLPPRSSTLPNTSSVTSLTPDQIRRKSDTSKVVKRIQKSKSTDDRRDFKSFLF